jgi:hypothetical protein
MISGQRRPIPELAAARTLRGTAVNCRPLPELVAAQAVRGKATIPGQRWPVPVFSRSAIKAGRGGRRGRRSPRQVPRSARFSRSAIKAGLSGEGLFAPTCSCM